MRLEFVAGMTAGTNLSKRTTTTTQTQRKLDSRCVATMFRATIFRWSFPIKSPNGCACVWEIGFCVDICSNDWIENRFAKNYLSLQWWEVWWSALNTTGRKHGKGHHCVGPNTTKIYCLLKCAINANWNLFRCGCCVKYAASTPKPSNGWTKNLALSSQM